MLLLVLVTKTIILLILLILLWVSSVLYSRLRGVCVGHHCPWDTSQSTIFNVMESWGSTHCGFTITIIILVMAACCVVAYNILLLLLLSCSRVRCERNAGQSPAILAEYSLNVNDNTYISQWLPKTRVTISDNQVL